MGSAHATTACPMPDTSACNSRLSHRISGPPFMKKSIPNKKMNFMRIATILAPLRHESIPLFEHPCETLGDGAYALIREYLPLAAEVIEVAEPDLGDYMEMEMIDALVAAIRLAVAREDRVVAFAEYIERAEPFADEVVYGRLLIGLELEYTDDVALRYDEEVVVMIRRLRVGEVRMIVLDEHALGKAAERAA